MVALDIAGVRFNRWTCLREVPSHISQKKVAARCDCGTEKEVYLNNLKRGLSRSCGCLSREVTLARFTTHGHASNGAVSPTLWSYRSMIRRCHHEGASNFKWYGGRGIAVCARWRQSFDAFLADMGERPSKAHTIDRYPDNNGDYEPGNCRWATMKEQCATRCPRQDHILMRSKRDCRRAA